MWTEGVYACVCECEHLLIFDCFKPTSTCHSGKKTLREINHC